MRSNVAAIMPPKLCRALAKLGTDIDVARRKRVLTVAMMCERTGIAKSTYRRVATGDPAVAIGVYAMCLFVLGIDGLAELADAGSDNTGLLMEQERLPKRVRIRRNEDGAL